MHQINVINDLLNWIEGNLDNNITLASITAVSGYSKWHLQRIFKYYTGQRIGLYIRCRKLASAARDLRLTDTPLVQIAEKYSFDSQSSFTRCFKKYFSVTPGAYRHRYRG